MGLFGYAPVVSASPEPLRWSNVNIPAGNEAGNWVLAEGSNLRRLALAGDGTLYAGVEGLTDTIYRSGNGGLTWTTAGNVHDAIVALVVSPVDPSKVYYATTSAVYRSTNGGRTFDALPASPGGAGTGNVEITALDAAGAGSNTIAVATRDTDSGEFGGVYFLEEDSIIPSWADTGIGNCDVYALAFSPDYVLDRTIIAVTSDETDVLIASQTGDNGWTATANRARLNRDNMTPPVSVSTVASAVIAFPGNYNADPASGNSICFIAVATGTGEGDIYQIEGYDAPGPARTTDLNAGQRYGYSNTDFTGLTVAGDYPNAILIAGEAGSSRTYTSSDGGLNWTRSRKEPSGTAVTCLLTAPDFAASGQIYAATSGANSALSVSRDLGMTWNQLSLIDTGLDAIIDLAPSPRYTEDNTLFMLTFGGEHSLWRSRTGGDTWERIFACHPGAETLKLVGLPPGYGDGCQAVFIAGESNGKPAVWQSTDDGQSYRCRLTHDPITGAAFSVDAWAIVDETSFFVGSYDGSHGLVYLTTTGGFTYSEGTPAGDQSLNSLAIAPFYAEDGIILAGNNYGGVYLSTDNNTSYRPLPVNATSPPLTGSVAIAFDPDFEQNHAVYAASNSPNGGIHRFDTATGREWVSIDGTLPAGATIDRLSVANEGTLYAADSRASGGLERCLHPAAVNTAFENVTHYLPGGATLYGLWERGHHLWSIDTTNVSLLTFYDTLTVPAAAVTPADQASGIGSLSDHAVKNISLDWEALEGATSYEWQCDFISEFTADALEGTTSASSVRLPVLEPSATYYWRVRASAPVTSPWSDKRSFTTILDTEAITLKPESPSPGATGVALKPTFQWTAISGAVAYELVAAENADFQVPVIDRTEPNAIPTNAWQCDINLSYATTYYWKVRAISQSSLSPWSASGLFTTGPDPALTPPEDVRPDTAPIATTSLLAAPQPEIPSTAQIKPAPTSSPPQNISAPPSFSGSLDVPVWVIYFLFGLVATLFLALFVILVAFLKIKR